jgi:hypothetical protein
LATKPLADHPYGRSTSSVTLGMIRVLGKKFASNSLNSPYFRGYITLVAGLTILYAVRLRIAIVFIVNEDNNPNVGFRHYFAKMTNRHLASMPNSKYKFNCMFLQV